MQERRRGTVALVLAAGQGQRFGDRTKQLAQVDGRPLVAHAVATALSAGIDRVLVVVGHDADAVAQAAATAGPIEVVRNPRHADGQSTSLVAGLRAAMDDEVARIAVVLLADQPGVDPAAVRAVTAEVQGGAVVARARYDDGPAHPIAFARRCWPQLAAVRGDAGARQLLGELDVVVVPVAGPAPRDVDTTGDLDELRSPGPA